MPIVRLLGLFCVLAAGQPAAAELRFFASGDVPYGPFSAWTYRGLLAEAGGQNPDFLIHVGDFKSGNSVCGDGSIESIRSLFAEQAVPLVYTPGDNDWADCHRPLAGGFRPLERLARLRERLFADDGVLKLGRLGVERPDAARPEQYLFERQRVLFVSLHLVGSNNNRREKDEESMREFREREQSVLDLLGQAFARVRAASLDALVLMFHADPMFERARPHPAYSRFLRALQAEVAQTAVPILAIHGDRHVYRLDHPLVDAASGRPFANFTRLQVPGAPLVRLVEIIYSPAVSPGFRVSPFPPEGAGDGNWGESRAGHN
jgi:hypothetical protein